MRSWPLVRAPDESQASRPSRPPPAWRRARCQRLRGAADTQPDASQPAAADDTSVAACSALPVAARPAALDTAVRLTFPAEYRTLPAWAMAAGRPPEPVDARI